MEEDHDIDRRSSHDGVSSHISLFLFSRHVVLGYLRRYGRFGMMHSLFSCMFAVFSPLPCSKKSISIPLYVVSIHSCSVLFAATRSTSPRLNIKRILHPPTIMDYRLLLEIGTREHEHAFGVFCHFRLYFSDTCDHVPYFSPTPVFRSGHVFHLDCIQRWLKTRSVCPLCNKEWDFSKIERIPGYGQLGI